MIGRKTMRWLALAAGLAVVACSDATGPSEPSSSAAPQFAAFEAQASVAGERHEELKRLLEERKAYFKARKEANKETLRAAKEEWKAWKHDWKEQFKLAREVWKREHPGEKGGPEVQLLRCQPRDYEADAAIIGPQGGTLKVGEHELVVPAGALDHEELVVAESSTSSRVDVQFAPHGLQFLKPAQLKLSYKGCVRPTSLDFLIAYIEANRVLELPPSVDHKDNDEVEAGIDHFSRYAIAY
jgi:hypothetical protein